MTYFNTAKTLLDNYAIQRRNKPGVLIAQKVAPMVPVMKDAAYYPIFGEEFIEDTTTGGIRTPSTRAERVDFTYSTDLYTTKERAFESFLDDQDKESAQVEFNVERQKVNIVTDKQLLRYERFCASKAFSVTEFSSFTAALAGADRWDNSSSDPRVQVDVAKNSIRNNGVVDPEEISLIVGAQVWIALSRNATLLSTFKYTNPYALSTDQVAKALGVKNVIVGGGTYKAAGVKSPIWGKFALFAFLNDAPELEDVSAMKTFVLKEKDIRIDTYYDEGLSSTVYRSKWNYDVKVTAKSSGYLFSTVIS